MLDAVERVERDLEVGGQLPEELTPSEIYRLLGCTEKTLQNWRRAGLESRTVRGRLRFLRRDLEAFLGGRPRR